MGKTIRSWIITFFVLKNCFYHYSVFIYWFFPKTFFIQNLRNNSPQKQNLTVITRAGLIQQPTRHNAEGPRRTVEAKNLVIIRKMIEVKKASRNIS